MRATTSSAPKALIICPVIPVSGNVRRVEEQVDTDRGAEGLRVRRCCDPTCNTLFTLCASCDRGQRYCTETCRKRMRKQQLQAAGRRYQASEAGKQNHCRRQQTCRQRQSRERVTHQGQVSITTSQPPQPTSLARCAVCGRENRWINPFYWVARRKRRPGDSEPAGDPSKFLRSWMIANSEISSNRRHDW